MGNEIGESFGFAPPPAPASERTWLVLTCKSALWLSQSRHSCSSLCVVHGCNYQVDNVKYSTITFVRYAGRMIIRVKVLSRRTKNVHRHAPKQVTGDKHSAAQHCQPTTLASDLRTYGVQKLRDCIDFIQDDQSVLRIQPSAKLGNKLVRMPPHQFAA